MMAKTYRHIPDIMKYRFEYGRHAGKRVSWVLKNDPDHIFDDWAIVDQSFVLYLRGLIVEVCKADDAKDIIEAERTDESDDEAINGLFAEMKRRGMGRSFKITQPGANDPLDYFRQTGEPNMRKAHGRFRRCAN